MASPEERKGITCSRCLGFRVPLLDTETSTFSWHSLAELMPERIGKRSVGVGRRHSVTIFKASFKALFIKQTWALQSTQLSTGHDMEWNGKKILV